jgi:hypothetical protein
MFILHITTLQLKRRPEFIRHLFGGQQCRIEATTFIYKNVS